jgi:hypothetical protein
VHDAPDPAEPLVRRRLSNRLLLGVTVGATLLTGVAAVLAITHEQAGGDPTSATTQDQPTPADDATPADGSSTPADPVTTTSAPSTTAAPIVDPLTSWRTSIATTMPAATDTSGVGLGSTGPVALAVGDGDATVWTYAADAWSPTATIDVHDLDPDTWTAGDDFYPAPVITVGDVTGDSFDDFLVRFTPNKSYGIVITGHGGTWRAPAFQYPVSDWTPTEPSEAVEAPEIDNGQLWSNENPCIPDCATAPSVSINWRLHGDHFVATNPESVTALSCSC